MKKNYFKNTMKFGIAAVLMLAIGTVNAQTPTADAGAGNVDQANADGPVIRVVDNKGTVKYLQSNNGITTITSTSAGETTTTTWQLGGALTDDTYIDATGQVFALDGIEFSAGIASTDAVSGDVVGPGGTGAGTGYTLLVRDEATGATQKLLMSDLVKGGVHNDQATAATNFDYTDATMPDDITKISVFRNGIKLLAGVNYTISGAVGSVEVSVNFSSAVANEEYSFITNDRIEVQWVQ